MAGPRPTNTAVSWVVVLHMLGRYALLSYASLGWPRYGVVGRQDGVPCESIICRQLPRYFGCAILCTYMAVV